MKKLGRKMREVGKKKRKVGQKMRKVGKNGELWQKKKRGNWAKLDEIG